MKKREGLFRKTIEGIEQITGDVSSPKVVLIEGSTGTYKTTFCIELAKNYCTINKSSVALYITLEQESTEILEDIKEKGIRIIPNLKFIDLGLQRTYPAKITRDARRIRKEVEREYVGEKEDDVKLKQIDRMMKEGIPREIIKSILALEKWELYNRAMTQLKAATVGPGPWTPEKIRTVRRRKLQVAGYPDVLVDFLVPKTLEEEEDSQIIGEEYVHVILDKVEDAKEKFGNVAIVIIDSLPILVSLLKSKEDADIRKDLLLLFSNFKSFEDIYTLLITEKAKQYESINDIAEYLSDGIIELGNKRELGKSRGKYIRIVKMRGVKGKAPSEAPHEFIVGDDAEKMASKIGKRDVRVLIGPEIK